MCVRHLEQVLLGSIAFVDVSGSQPYPFRLLPGPASGLEGPRGVRSSHICRGCRGPIPGSLLQQALFLGLESLYCVWDPLGYPVPYTFHENQVEDNCLAQTPLRVFTARISWLCCQPPVLLYSFSVPGEPVPVLEGHLATWEKDL